MILPNSTAEPRSAIVQPPSKPSPICPLRVRSMCAQVTYGQHTTCSDTIENAVWSAGSGGLSGENNPGDPNWAD